MKQMIIIVGAPASGKSYFVNTSFSKVPQNASLKLQFPRLVHLSVGSLSESDNSLRRLQYEAAKEDFELLWDFVRILRKTNSDSEIRSDFENFLKTDENFRYTPEGESPVYLASFLTFEDFITNRTSMASYFGKKGDPVNKYYMSMRGRGDEDTSESLKEKARAIFEDSTKAKFKRVGDAIIIDSAGEDITSTPFERFFKIARDENFSVTLVELNIPLELSLLRNEIRGQKGRKVPDAQVTSAYKKMQQTVAKLKKNPNVDRYVKYIWKSKGDGPFDGNFVVSQDERVALRRRIEEMRARAR